MDTLTQLERRVQQMETALARLLQIGTITNVENGKARVKFQGTGITSDWLTSLNGTQYVPEQIGTYVLVFFSPRTKNSAGYILGRL